MDDPAVEEEAHVRALAALNRVNRLLRANQALYGCLRRLSSSRSLSVLDLGAGGGGFLGYLYDRLLPDSIQQDQRSRPEGRGAANSIIGPSREGILLIGLDRSLSALCMARQWQSPGIRWVCGDATSIPLGDGSVDVVTCSLFLHHFDDAAAAGVLREAARVARCGVIAGDLSRSRLAWAATWVGTRLLSRSQLFHVDGPRSVRAAFSADELAAVAQEGGLIGAEVLRRFPFRLLLTWRKG